MRILGLEGTHHFQADGGVENVCHMVVELTNGEQFRVAIDSVLYTTLAQLGDYAKGVESSGKLLLSSIPKDPNPTKGPEQSLEEFANSFVTGPNNKVPEQQIALAQELLDVAGEEVEKAHDPLSQLRKIGMFGEPRDVMSSLSSMESPNLSMSTREQNTGPDVIESFEDTSQYEEDDPGEEHPPIAEQY